MIKFDLIPMWVKGLVLLALIAGSWGHGFYRGGKDKQADWNKEKLDLIEAHQKAEKELRDKNNKVSEDLQEALKNVRVEYKYVTDTVQVEVEKPVYKNCKIPASGAAVLQNNAQRLNDLRVKQ